MAYDIRQAMFSVADKLSEAITMIKSDRVEYKADIPIGLEHTPRQLELLQQAYDIADDLAFFTTYGKWETPAQKAEFAVYCRNSYDSWKNRGRKEEA